MTRAHPSIGEPGETALVEGGPAYGRLPRSKDFVMAAEEPQEHGSRNRQIPECEAEPPHDPRDDEQDDEGGEAPVREARIRSGQGSTGSGTRGHASGVLGSRCLWHATFWRMSNLFRAECHDERSPLALRCTFFLVAVAFNLVADPRPCAFLSASGLFLPWRRAAGFFNDTGMMASVWSVASSATQSLERMRAVRSSNRPR